ncbi:MAG: TldD/PmbA family protein [Desulfurococcaceae archaeon TW002]
MSFSEELLTRLIDEGAAAGASYVEVRYQNDYGSSVSMRNGKVLGVRSFKEEGVGIRVLANGSLGFAATNDLSREGLSKALEYAISRARSVAQLRRGPIQFTEEKVGRASYEVVPKIKLEDVSMEGLMGLGREVFKVLTESVSQVKLPVCVFSAETHTQEKLIITSDGAYARSRIPRMYVSANLVLFHPQKGTLQRMKEFGSSGGGELLDAWRPIDVLVEEAKKLEVVLVSGVEPPKEPVDVVVGSEIVGLLVHESAGHPMEADRILGREAAQAGESYVKREMIGKFRIGNELATVIEDPTIPGSNGFYLYDDEGVPARPRYLYKEGIINEALHNRHTANIFGVKSNAAARAMNYASEPIIRMSNTYFKPGTMSFDELIEDISTGVFIKSYMEWNIDDIRWNQRYVGLEAYVIRNGELVEPIRNPVLEITTQGFYSNIVAADKELKFYPGTCGKGEPSQGVPVWFGGPNVRISKIRLGVTA